MGKFSGFVFGTTASVIISYYFLSQYYSPLLGWLEPTFGSGLALVLGLIFLLLGNPFIYPVVIAAWIAIGFVVGLSVRRVKGSIVSMIFVHAACWIIMVIVVAGAVLGLLPSGGSFLPTSGQSVTSVTSPISSLASIPSPPFGTNILTIISEPVILQVFHTLMNLLPQLFSSSGSSSTTFTGSATSAFESYALPAILANIFTFVVSLIVAALVAHYARKFIMGLDSKHARRPPVTYAQVMVLLSIAVALSFMLSTASAGLAPVTGIYSTSPSPPLLSSHPSRSATAQVNSAIEGFSEMNAVISRLTALPEIQHPASSSSATGAVSSNRAYDEALLNLISSDGNLYSGYLFASNYSLPQNSIPDNSQVGLSLLLLSQNLKEMPFQSLTGTASNTTGTTPVSPVSSTTTLPVSSILGLVPPSLLFVSVNPGSQSALKVADEQVSYYSRLTAENFTMLLDLYNFSIGTSIFGGGNSSLTNSSTKSTSTGSGLFIFASDFPAAEAAASVSATYLPSLHQGGLIDSFSSMLSTGSLFTPTQYGSDSGFLAIGYKQPSSALPTLNSSSPSSILAYPKGNIAFCMGLFYKSDFIFGSGNHSIPLSTFTGSSPLSFSPTASTSAVILLSPTGYNDFSLTSIQGGFHGTVFTDVPLISNLTNITTLNTSAWTVIDAPGNSSLSSDTPVDFSSPLPPEVVVTDSASASGRSITINAVVRDLSNETVSGLSVYFPGYGAPLSNISSTAPGAAYDNVSSLSSGQSFDAQFRFNAPHAGMYVLPKLQYTFSAGGHSFVLFSTSAQASVSAASVFTMFPNYFSEALYGIASHVSPGSTYSEMQLLSYSLLTLFMALAIYSEFSSFRKWRSSRSRSVRPLIRSVKSGTTSTATPSQKVETVVPVPAAPPPPSPPSQGGTAPAVAEEEDVPESDKPAS